MIDISWKEGFVTVRSESTIDNYSIYEIIFGENEFPFYRYGFENNINYKLHYNFYIEYNIKVYGYNPKRETLELITERQFNCENQKLLFELYPKTQNELDVWISYLENFSRRKKFMAHCVVDENFKINSSIIKKIDGLVNNDFYSKYKICWDQDYFINPRGWLNLSSFELINNTLFRI